MLYRWIYPPPPPPPPHCACLYRVPCCKAHIRIVHLFWSLTPRLTPNYRKADLDSCLNILQDMPKQCSVGVPQLRPMSGCAEAVTILGLDVSVHPFAEAAYQHQEEPLHHERPYDEGMAMLIYSEYSHRCCCSCLCCSCSTD